MSEPIDDDGHLEGGMYASTSAWQSHEVGTEAERDREGDGRAQDTPHTDSRIGNETPRRANTAYDVYQGNSSSNTNDEVAIQTVPLEMPQTNGVLHHVPPVPVSVYRSWILHNDSSSFPSCRSLHRRLRAILQLPTIRSPAFNRLQDI